MPLDLKQKNILVTGGAGFVGRYVVENLIKKRGVAPSNIIIPRSAQMDLRIRENAKKAVEGVDVVFHLAAVSGGIGFSAEHPGKMFYENAVIGMNLIDTAREANIEKFIHIGSYNEYPKSAAMPLKEEALWDGLPDGAFLSYGMAKRMLLMQLQAYRVESGFNGIHLIMASMFGPGGPVNNLIPSLMRQIQSAKEKGGEVIGWGTGKATRDLLYVEDAAEGIVLAAEKYNKPEPLNIGSGREIPVRDVISLLCSLIGFQGHVRWDTSKPEGQQRYIMDIARAEHELDFRPIVSLEEGLRRTIGVAS